MKRLSSPVAATLFRALRGSAALAILAVGLFGSGQALAGAANANDTVERCSWDKPGRNPFVGDVVAAVDRYKDIPESVRATLKRRMAAREYDEFVAIERDAIIGKLRYEPAIRDMHFGTGRVCKTVTRAKWTAEMRERGLVYCESGYCILVPTVCRNVSRINRVVNDLASSAGAGERSAAEVFDAADDSFDPAPADSSLGNAFGDGLAAGNAPGLNGVVRSASLIQSTGSFSRSSSNAVGPGSQFNSPFAGGTSFSTGAGSSSLSPVPEAPAWMMVGAALLCIGALRRRRAATRA